MKPEQQRIAIAEWCGWTECANAIYYENELRFHPKHSQIYGKPPSGCSFCEIHDYPNDLNAMWEVESNLFPIHVWDHSKPDLWTEYTARLDMICIGHSGGVYHATAAQRAEALLRTIGKWTTTTDQRKDK